MDVSGQWDTLNVEKPYSGVDHWAYFAPTIITGDLYLTFSKNHSVLTYLCQISLLINTANVIHQLHLQDENIKETVHVIRQRHHVMPNDQ